jgi:hypothetical protein
MGLQRILFINKEGQPCDMTLDIIRKQSKVIVTRNPEDGTIMNIPRQAVDDILEPVKDDDKN